MTDHVRKWLCEFQDKLGLDRLESLHLELAGDCNNWKLAEKYRLTITEIRFLDMNSNAVTVYLHQRKQGLRLVYSRVA